MLVATLSLYGCQNKGCCGCGPSLPWAVVDCPCYSLGREICTKMNECGDFSKESSFDECLSQATNAPDTGCLRDCERLDDCRAAVRSVACDDFEEVVDSCSDLCMGVQ